MGVFVSKSEASNENILKLASRSADSRSAKRPSEGGKSGKALDDGVASVVLGCPVIHSGSAARPPAFPGADPASVPASGAGTVDGLLWLFPEKDGPALASTIFMNVWGENVKCAACKALSMDYRGTVFQCCKAVVCSRCATRACLVPAERLRLDLNRSLTGSGRVLERVVCPLCKKPERVGFPVNGNYGRLYSDSRETAKT